MIRTLLYNDNGEAKHRSGSSGMTVTARRNDDEEVGVCVEWACASHQELACMLFSLLLQMEQKQGRSFVEECVLRWAEESGRTMLLVGSLESDGSKTHV